MVEKNNSMGIQIEFDVVVCFGPSETEEVSVSAAVTPEEYEALISCAENDEDISSCANLSYLVERIEGKAIDAAYDSVSKKAGDTADYDCPTCMIYLPEEMHAAIEE